MPRRPLAPRSGHPRHPSPRARPPPRPLTAHLDGQLLRQLEAVYHRRRHERGADAGGQRQGRRRRRGRCGCGGCCRGGGAALRGRRRERLADAVWLRDACGRTQHTITQHGLRRSSGRRVLRAAERRSSPVARPTPSRPHPRPCTPATRPAPPAALPCSRRTRRAVRPASPPPARPAGGWRRGLGTGLRDAAAVLRACLSGRRRPP
jgi:hypothetical protein